jgi:hypothetical protein
MNYQSYLKSTCFILSPVWDTAHWSATTFRWHPRSEAPPLMGLVFDDAMAGQDLFCSWAAEHGNLDPLEEIRVAVIEGEIEGLRSGYTVHLSGDIEGILARATAEGVVVPGAGVPWGSRVNRMHPLPDSPPLLARFKEEYGRHGEYLLAPVTRRGDGQLWFDVELGIVKHKVHFRHVSEITDKDVDSVVKLAELIRPQPPG